MITLLGKENVLALEVAMEDLSIVDVLDGQTQLHRPVKNLLLGKRNPLLGIDSREKISYILLGEVYEW